MEIEEYELPDVSGEGLAMAENIPARLDLIASRNRNDVAIRCDEDEITWNDLRQKAARISRGLLEEGLSKGARVGIIANGSVDYLTIFLGVVGAGCCVVPIQTMISPDSILRTIEDSGARALFVSESEVEGVEAACSTLLERMNLSLFAIDFEKRNWKSISDWTIDIYSDPMPAVYLEPDTPFNIIYSSGTTGTPKGIVHSHRARAVLAAGFGSLGFDESTVCLIASPLYTNLSVPAFIATLWGGGKAVILTKFDPKTYLRRAESERATHFFLVPNQIQRLLEFPDFDKADLGSSKLKYFGGASTPLELKRELRKRWPGVNLEVYGMTEGAPATGMFHNDIEADEKSVGLSMRGGEVKIIDDAGREVNSGETGEIVGRTGMMMTGYHNQLSLTEAMIWKAPDGSEFFRSGDLGHVDEKGLLYIDGRKKEMIISGGINIYATDLENVLRSHPDVVDAAVVGVPHKRWGETPVGVVELYLNQLTEGADICAWANERLGKYQRLSRVEVWRVLPRNAMEKVVKSRVKERLN